jgi:hypothetical protein
MRIASCWNDRGTPGAGVSLAEAPRIRPSQSIQIPLLALALLGLAGCGNDNLDESQQLGPLRVLALVADMPEVTIDDPAGSNVLVTAWVSDYDRGGEPGRNLTFSYASCPDPGISYGVEPKCADDARLSYGGGTIAGGTLNAANAYTAVAFTQSVSIPTTSYAPWAAYLASKTATEKANGVAILVHFKISSGTESTTAFRRIIATTRTGAALNTKPAGIASISPATLPTSEGKVSPVLNDTADSYTVLLNDGSTISRTEKLTVSWYTTAGEFKFNRTDGGSANTWTPPTTGTAKVFLFLRDDRGGVSDALAL